MSNLHLIIHVPCITSVNPCVLPRLSYNRKTMVAMAKPRTAAALARLEAAPEPPGKVLTPGLGGLGGDAPPAPPVLLVEFDGGELKAKLAQVRRVVFEVCTTMERLPMKEPRPCLVAMYISE